MYNVFDTQLSRVSLFMDSKFDLLRGYFNVKNLVIYDLKYVLQEFIRFKIFFNNIKMAGV